LLADEPEDVQQEILDINTDARPIALQVALLIPVGGGAHRPRQLLADAAAAGSAGVGLG
jgi:hypothetical protein